MLRKSVLLGTVLSVLALATSARADFTYTFSDGTVVRRTPVSGEVTILDVYNHVYAGELSLLSMSPLTWDGLNAELIAPNQLWTETMGTVTARARFAGFQQQFGYYTDIFATGGDGSDRSALFTITSASGYLTDPEVDYNASGSSLIGFYRTGPDGNLWFSEVALNSDHADHLIAFFSPTLTSTLLFWEDLPRCAWDRDDNDLAVQLVGVTGGGGQIPEPSSILLVLTGLSGLAYWRKRK